MQQSYTYCLSDNQNVKNLFFLHLIFWYLYLRQIYRFFIFYFIFLAHLSSLLSVLLFMFSNYLLFFAPLVIRFAPLVIRFAIFSSIIIDPSLCYPNYSLSRYPLSRSCCWNKYLLFLTSFLTNPFLELTHPNCFWFRSRNPFKYLQ
jgi:hypothetical protein